MWYPQNPKELNELLDKYFSEPIKQMKINEIHGLIVHHAGYEFSGKIAGKTFALLKNKNFKKAIILSPSHYFPLRGIYTHNENSVETCLGKIKITASGFPKTDISGEHAIDNQIPFLKKLKISEILPLVVGNISKDDAKKIALEISKFINEETIIIISTDLSHFLPYESAVKKDKKTISAISNLDIEGLIKEDNSACGIYPLIIFIELCMIKKWKPELIEYKNSGDITGIKNSVVGYAGMVF
jgi:hypothetical protein